jgi:hypothetical protein
MSIALITHLHAWASWLAAIGLLAAVLLFVRRSPLAPRIQALATAVLAVAFGTGVALDNEYRSHLRQRIFLASTKLGWLFERKLHVAFFAMTIGLAAAISAYAARDASRRSASFAAVLTLTAALAACAMSVYVAMKRGF